MKRFLWAPLTVALLLPAAALAADQEVYPLRPEVNMPYQPKTANKAKTGPSSATATATANPHINIKIYVNGARVGVGSPRRCAGRSCAPRAPRSVYRAPYSRPPVVHIPPQPCPPPPRLVALCQGVGGQRVVTLDGVNWSCLDAGGRRLSPSGAVIGYAR